jgi:hypothetical protein
MALQTPVRGPVSAAASGQEAPTVKARQAIEDRQPQLAALGRAGGNAAPGASARKPGQTDDARQNGID